ncbi:unnamed protein product, partial [Leptidea sinapis]
MPQFLLKTNLRTLHCTIIDDNAREHKLCVEKQPSTKKLKVVSVNLPFTSFQEQEYNNIEDLTNEFLLTINNLSSYLYELETIDHNCIVVEPKNPTFKDDFRNLYLDDRTWLHIEVTPDGSASNVHLIGQSNKWQDKLQKGILKWDHDKNIDLSAENTAFLEDDCSENITCSICFCTELPDNPGLPQPLCNNPSCDVNYHKSCLFQ